jgi:hypothetical protein
MRLHNPNEGGPSASVARRLALAFAGLLAVTVAVLGGCGGGVGTGGTGGFASGPITGFGSVIVNSVRFDDSGAQVLDGDGVAHTRDDLRLGMTVDIDSSTISTDASGTATAQATRIRYDSDLLGPIGSVDQTAGTFTVLGQLVVIDSTTVFSETLGGIDALRSGQSVEVYAVFDSAAQRYRATRVSAPASSALAHVRGLVAQADATAKTLRIGEVIYGYTGASGVPSNVGAGQYVRITVSNSTPTAGNYPVQAFGTAVASPPDSDDGSLKGLISSFVSSRSFSVNGRPVDASTADFPNGTAGLGVGVNVEISGALRDGTLRATRVKITSDAQQSSQLFELHGAVTAVNAAQNTFSLRGVTVSTVRPDLLYQGGNVTNLIVGRQLTVKGKLSSDGLRVEATLIAFE